ncbi:MAG: DNA alkylation repair protein [Myxococcota bacterium]
MGAPVDDVMAQLEAAGTEQNRKVYQRHGAKAPLFGVSFTEQKKIAKGHKRDQKLADALWDTGNADARYLAAQIADPEGISKTRLRAWAKGIDHYVLVELLAKNVTSKSPLAWELTLDWTRARGEWAAALGWATLANLAMSDDGRPAREYEAYLKRIEEEIGGAANRVRHEMNGALIAIGTRSDGLARKATAAAKRIGPVIVDHGETSCKTPDAVPYIAKARAHRAAKTRK